MSNDFNNSESPRIADGAFEAFIENELLPQVGLSRSAFDNLLNQLNIASLSEPRRATIAQSTSYCRTG